ncbi:MAG TPA: hypothetical protein VH419_17010 [Nocardioidaceae bacterium]|jgi:hypothetical protein
MIKKKMLRMAIAVAAVAAPLTVLTPNAHASGGDCSYTSSSGEQISLEDGQQVWERDGDSPNGYFWACQEGTLIFAGYGSEPDWGGYTPGPLEN